jgi:uncharacterized HAD superfamily protein
MMLGIDIDGVLADLHTPLLAWHNQRYGTHITAENSTSYDLGKSFKCSIEEAFSRARKFFEEEAEKIALIEGAVEAVKRLKEKHTLYTVTSRMPEHWAHTHAWLDRHFNGMFAERIFCTNHDERHVYMDKGALCRQRGINLLIDDCLQYVNDCSDAGIPALLFDLNGTYGWNRGEAKRLVTRVHSWREAEKYIDSLV